MQTSPKFPLLLAQTQKWPEHEQARHGWGKTEVDPPRRVKKRDRDHRCHQDCPGWPLGTPWPWGHPCRRDMIAARCSSSSSLQLDLIASSRLVTPDCSVCSAEARNHLANCLGLFGLFSSSSSIFVSPCAALPLLAGSLGLWERLLGKGKKQLLLRHPAKNHPTTLPRPCLGLV